MAAITIQKLIGAAMEAREKSYCPFSNFSVGAALLTSDGVIYKGCNVEISGGSSNCGERTAVFKAVSEGHTQFDSIAIVGGKKGEQPDVLCTPCGVCRQVLAEFGDLDRFQVILATDKEHYEIYSLGELLPMAFRGN